MAAVRPQIGFREAGSHRIVGLSECHVMAPELFAMVGSAASGLLARRKGKYAADIELTLTDQGVDCGLKGLSFEGLEQAEGLLDFAGRNALARLTIDDGFGPETRWEPEPVTVTLSGVAVPFPPGAFLQATSDGEAALVGAAREWLAGAGMIADLFSGLGTFAFALAGPAKVLAAEAAREAHLACKAAAGTSARPVHALHRDLFRNPLQPDELNRFDARGARSAARRRARAGDIDRRRARSRGSSISAATRQAGRAMRRCWWRVAIGWRNCARSGSSAGRPMSNWRACS